MNKPILWLLLADRMNPAVPAVVPTLAWISEERGALLEMYLEAERDGRLFAQTGSTVLGGHHHQQFNYLHAVFDVRYLVLGEPGVFASSLKCFGCPIIAQGKNAIELYRALDISLDGPLVALPKAPVDGEFDLRPYFYQEIFFRRAIGVPAEEADVKPNVERLSFADGADVGTVTTELAERWADGASGVGFGDPDAVRSMLATLCREKRVTLFAPTKNPLPQEIVVSGYTERSTPVADVVRRLCERTGNRLISGRQTCDGDLFAWSKSGIGIEIMDPNRPAFPVVRAMEHRWHNREETVFDHEPDDAMLEQWAGEGKTLCSLLVHSGEMAHNEAMLHLVDLCATTGLKMGIGVHVARYETCPQMWELISIPRAKGGALGLIEPVLHSGGRGVVAESTCPPHLLAEHCRAAQERIGEICGEGWRPKGYLSFMDTDMTTFTRLRPEVYDAVAKCGLDCTISAAWPGRNRVLHHKGEHVVLNQSSRTNYTGSPYTRISSVDDINECSPGTSPGWWLGVIDAPVVSFNPYIWRHGHEFMKIVERLLQGDLINVTPNVVARYARVLQKRGVVPQGVPSGDFWEQSM